MIVRVEYRGRAAYLPDADVLVLADLHVGRDATSAVELPLGEREDILDRLDALLGELSPGEVIVAGDLLHAFDEVPRGVQDTVRAVERAVAESGADLVVTPGNHDTMLDAVCDARTVPEYRVGDALVSHGHERPGGDADLYVVGHEHPAIEIEGQRRPCFLRGPAAGDEVLVLPAFSRLASGTAVNALSGGDLLVPFVADVGALRPVVSVDGEALEFPPLEKLRTML